MTEKRISFTSFFVASGREDSYYKNSYCDFVLRYYYENCGNCKAAEQFVDIKLGTKYLLTLTSY